MLNIPLSGIKKIEAIAQSSPEYISLSQGALRAGGIPKDIKNYLKTILNTDKTDYYQSAWGIVELRKKLSQILSQKHQTTISADQIIITHGCIGALSTLFFTILEQGDEVIIPEPTYPAYEKLTLLVRAKPVFVSCLNTLRDANKVCSSGRTGEGNIHTSFNEQSKNQESLNEQIKNKESSLNEKSEVSLSPVRPEEERSDVSKDIQKTNSEWFLDIEKIKKATTKKTKAIIFPNPWNPLGLIVPQKTILELKSWCEENQIYLVIDEAYKDYAFDDSFKSVVPLVNESDFVVSTESFSKSMGMSGWRVGYMIVPPKLCHNLGTTQDALLNCPNVPAQHAAVYALDHPEHTKYFYEIIKNNISLCDRYLKPLVDQKIFSYQKPQGGFFLFLKANFDDATNLGMDILNKAKVALVPGKYFGESGASYLRLCYARDTEVLEEGLKRLLKYFL